MRIDETATEIALVVTQYPDLYDGDFTGLFNAAQTVAGTTPVTGLLGTTIITGIVRCSNGKQTIAWQKRSPQATFNSLFGTAPGSVPVLPNSYVVPKGGTLIAVEVFTSASPWVLSASLMGGAGTTSLRSYALYQPRLGSLSTVKCGKSAMTSPGLLKRGSVTIMTGLLAIPLVAMTGAAIDLARIWLVKSRLQMSLDAAVLVVARDLATGGTSVDGLNLFWANFGRSSSPEQIGCMGATATDPMVHNPAPGGVAGSMQLTSTAIVTPTLLGIIGIGPVTVNGASTAQSAAYGLELALVLDNTGSMAGSSITSLISASNQLLGHPVWRRRHAAASVGLGRAIRRHDQYRQHAHQLAGRRHHQSGALCAIALDGLRDGAHRRRPARRTATTSTTRRQAQAPFKPFLYKSTYHVTHSGPIGIIPATEGTRSRIITVSRRQ